MFFTVIFLIPVVFLPAFGYDSNSDSNIESGTYYVSNLANKTYDIPYTIINGTVKEMRSHPIVFEVLIHSSGNGSLTVEIPKAAFTFPIGNYIGSPLFVVGRYKIGGVEVGSEAEYEEINQNPSSKILLIPFRDGSTEITISSVAYTQIEWYDVILGSKFDAGRWAKGELSDNHFASQIRNMMENGTVKGPVYEFDSLTDDPFEFIASPAITYLPSWIKTTAGWWSEEKITDREFISAIEYLIKIEAIRFADEAFKIATK